jgi:hypothetical protein
MNRNELENSFFWGARNINVVHPSLLERRLLLVHHDIKAHENIVSGNFLRLRPRAFAI